MKRILLQQVSGLRNRHLLVVDVLLLSTAPLLALILRLEGVQHLPLYAGSLLWYTLLAVLVRIAVFQIHGLYSRYWRDATVDEMVLVITAAATSTLITGLIFVATHGFSGWGTSLPRSLPILEGFIAFTFAAGSRFSVRLSKLALRRRLSGGTDVLIFGAGGAGQRIAREMVTHSELGLNPVGFLDDDPAKKGLNIARLPVLGGRDRLISEVKQRGVRQVIIAMPSAAGKTIRDIVNLCEEAGVQAKTVPGMNAILDDRVHVSQIRSVEIEDLLRRAPVQTDTDAVGRLLRGRRVLVTGAGGSIGSELCRQILGFHPKAIGLLGHGENSIFDILAELRTRAGTMPDGTAEIEPIIADIRFAGRIDAVFRNFAPDVVFHAAAHKHVPLMESNAVEAVTNNVFGTQNLLNAAAKHNVERFVMISTDKAVNPTSIMGATKRVAERILQKTARDTGRAYSAVRFGNVLGSRGSVIPTFKRQIAAGGPITVTHPEMTRYFMTIPEAVQLTLQASVLGSGGEVFMLDMGEPVRIVDLAVDLIELSGLQVGRDIDIRFTGIRPGEKLFEELLMSGETYAPTRHEKIRIATSAAQQDDPDFEDSLAALNSGTARQSAEEIVRALGRLVPEYSVEEISAERIDPAEYTVVSMGPGMHRISRVARPDDEPRYTA
jgi:FlaA1/EpsC-like NDP-sugar epimerase